MRIRFLPLCLALLAVSPAAAESSHDEAHGSELFHKFVLEADTGGGRHGPLHTWDFDGWIGGNMEKLWLKSEGEIADGETEQAEFWALYSRTIAEFWDFQAGIRHDTQPTSTSYAVIGVEGLAPYFFETDAHLFVSDEGDVSARLRAEIELLLTQRLVLAPYTEANLFAQDVPGQDVGAGLSDAELGLMLRYEITRKIAPYVDLKYERAFGETAAIAHSNNEPRDDAIASVGVKLMF